MLRIRCVRYRSCVDLRIEREQDYWSWCREMPLRVHVRETDLEEAITGYLKHALPAEAVSFHVPQGGFKLSPWELGVLKRAGYVAGIPDRCIIWNGTAYFLEAKGSLGRLSEAQERMIGRLGAAGARIAVVRSVDDVERALIGWGIPINVRLL